MMVEVSFFARWDREDLGRKWTTSSTQGFSAGTLGAVGTVVSVYVSTAFQYCTEYSG